MTRHLIANGATHVTRAFRLPRHLGHSVISLVVLVALLCVPAINSPQSASAATGTSAVIDMATSGFGGCVVTSAGEAYCWSYKPQTIGDGSSLPTSTPRKVVATQRFKSIASMSDQTCALSTDDEAYCWGVNTYGSLGDGTTTDKTYPTKVDQLGKQLKFTKIAAQSATVCGIAKSGTGVTPGAIFCWGYNGDGQLGIAPGDTTQRLVPTAIAGTGTFTDLAVGSRAACAIRTDQIIRCWGYNGDGRLGNGTTTNSQVPVSVSGGSLRFTQVAAGDYNTCAIATNTEAYCWGRNDSIGQIGTGSTASQNYTTPTDPVAGSHQFVEVSVGDSSACGRTSGGAAWCWGYNSFGQLGDGTSSNRSTPVAVSTTATFRRLSASALYTCGIKAEGPFCWGRSSAGDLGNGQRVVVTAPQQVRRFTDPQLPALSSVSGNAFHSCGVAATSDASNGQIWCWGAGYAGQTGQTWGINTRAPEAVTSNERFTTVTSGAYYSCAIGKNDAPGKLYCWGQDSAGELGLGYAPGQRAYTPTLLSTAVTFIKVEAGPYHGCAIDVSSKVFCWGANANGRLGDGTNTSRNVPTAIDTGNTYLAVSPGRDHTCGLRTNGKIYCWGADGEGQLGNSTNGESWSPTAVDSTDTFTAIESGDYHTCALRASDGATLCWGRNTYGQLGSAGGNAVSPRVTAGSFVKLSAGGNHTCGIEADGTPKCWGRNRYGQLGVGDYADRSAPTAVSTPQRFASIMLGDDITFGLGADGRAFAWGINTDAQLGIEVIRYETPQRLLIYIDGVALSMSATIPAALSFSIQGLNSGTCNGATINRTNSTSATVSLGEQSISSNAIGGQTITVSTNAANGYALSFRALDDFKSAVHTMHNVATGGSSPNTVPFPAAGNENVGYSSDRVFSPNTWTGLSTVSTTVGSSSVPVENDITHMCYQAGAANTTPAGTYATTLVLSVLPSF